MTYTGLCLLNTQTELTRGLVIIVMEKIIHDLPEQAYEEANFSHLIDEVLLFDSELRNTYFYPPILPGCLDVLCLPEALTKWLIIEKKCKLVIYYCFLGGFFCFITFCYAAWLNNFFLKPFFSVGLH